MVDLSKRKLVNEVTLPSRGYRYEGKIPEGRVKIAAVTAAVEEKVAGLVARGKGNQLLTYYVDLNSDFGSADISAEDLQLGDCLFLAIQIRALTFGPEYQYSFTCPSCGNVSQQTINVNDQDVIAYTDSDVEPYEVKLPRADATVLVRQPRIKDMATIRKFLQAQANKGLMGDEDPYSLFGTALCIQSINGKTELDAFSKYLWVKDLLSSDYNILKTAIEDNECGYVFEDEATCPICKHVEEIDDLPLGPEFFRPGVSKRRKRARQNKESVSVLLSNKNNDDRSGADVDS